MEGKRRGLIDRVSEGGLGANDIGLSFYILETWCMTVNVVGGWSRLAEEGEIGKMVRKGNI